MGRGLVLGNVGKRFYCVGLGFVPKHEPVLEREVELLENFIRKYERILVLTGAGISTESGIPDYRSEEVGLYARTNHRPIQYHEFIKSASTRRRYWARNFIGWPRFSQRQPNATHFAITSLEKNKKTTAIVTQNVDNLHQKAGSVNVIELHGTSYVVKCLNCENVIGRHEHQDILTRLNPGINDEENRTRMIRPDGDVDIPQEIVDDFVVPVCDRCNGVYKPDIVFFGDNVPKPRVDLIRRKVEASDSVLVLGSSLSVFSSYRIVLQAKSLKLPVAIVNIGPTRADDLSSLKLSGKCGEILPGICKSLFR